MRTVRAQASWGWRRLSGTLAALALLAGCQQGGGSGYPGAPPGEVSPMLGALGGAGAGALAAG